MTFDRNLPGFVQKQVMHVQTYGGWVVWIWDKRFYAKREEGFSITRSLGIVGGISALITGATSYFQLICRDELRQSSHLKLVCRQRNDLDTILEISRISHNIYNGPILPLWSMKWFLIYFWLVLSIRLGVLVKICCKILIVIQGHLVWPGSSVQSWLGPYPAANWGHFSLIK